MTNVVIDNSTLTAVERVLGYIPLDKNYDLSGDLAAFESYLCALVFYDQPIRIDDYKPEFSKVRAKNFAELGSVKFEDDSYEVLLSEAREITSNIHLKIHGGDLEDNIIGQFLKDIDLHVCPAWHMQSSDFYLRIRLLADETGVAVQKYSPLMSAIFDQLSENKNAGKKPNWAKTLIGSDGKEVREKIGKGHDGSRKIGSDIHAFSAGLNWLALRSVFYALVSEHLQATVICHPIRNDFLARFYVSQLGAVHPDQRKAVISYFQATARELIDQSNELLGGSAFKLHAPLISAWATLSAGSPRKALEHVLDVRYSPEAIAMRARMRDIEQLQTGGDIEPARKNAATLFRDFQFATEAFFRKFGKKGDDPFSISANILGMSGSFKLVPALQKAASLLPHRARSTALLRNITLDLIQSPSLGNVSNMLRSDANITSDEIESVYHPKFEKPRFRYARSYWKEPM